ncbi:MAG TPA: GreA/GreB family elongation factor [Candidatus Limnocylindria bacterium]|nr:GreA/GreB family elongation factor [Candidatus Limnocylindria bacterium]
MRDELEKLAAAGKIESRHVDPLLRLLEAGFCQHRSWGFGRVAGVDSALGRLNIDFNGKKGHSMDMAFAVDSLKPVPKDHIVVRKNIDLPALKQEAALHHLNVVKLAVKSLGGKATADQLAEVLKDVVGGDWKKWWEVARSEMKKDGHFTVPLKKTEAIVYQEAEISLGQRLIVEFRAAKGLKAKVAVAIEILKSVPDIGEKQVLVDVIAGLNADIQSHVQTMPVLAMEGMFVRDELRTAASIPATEPEIEVKDVWNQAPKLKEFFEELPGSKHRRALESFKGIIPDWGAQLVLIINEVPAKLAGECARLLLIEGRGQLLKDTLARLISQHAASSELLLWLGKERGDHFADILGPEVFRAMLTAMERDAFNEKKSNRLHDFILEDIQLLPNLIESADIEVIRDLTRNLQLSPSFDDMDKRSLLARIVKMYPAIQEMITGDHKKEEHIFLVSWESLQRRQLEYQTLVEKQIPANVKDIALARSYGDLRENHEYKSAKEMQKVLNRRKHELESQLGRARGTDFANPRTDVVSPGTVVRVTDLSAGKEETYSVMGAWDGDPEKGILSYLTPMAQALMNRAPKEEVSFKSGGVERRFRIESVAVPEKTAV